MMKIGIHKAILFLVLFFYSESISAQIEVLPRPSNPKNAVNDFVDCLGQTTKFILESKLRNYYDSTTNEIVVIIVDSLNGQRIEDVALAYGKSWIIGNADKDNGIIILLALKNRKIRIELGLGFEKNLSEPVLKEIIQNQFVPNLKKQNYYEALDKGINALLEEIKSSSYKEK
jgi:uncharacterized protein